MRFSVVRVFHDSTVTPEIGNVEDRSEVFAIQGREGREVVRGGRGPWPDVKNPFDFTSFPSPPFQFLTTVRTGSQFWPLIL